MCKQIVAVNRNGGLHFSYTDPASLCVWELLAGTCHVRGNNVKNKGCWCIGISAFSVGLRGSGLPTAKVAVEKEECLWRTLRSDRHCGPDLQVDMVFVQLCQGHACT